MRLRDLDASFLRLLPEGPLGSCEMIGDVRCGDPKGDAHGVTFQCPQCASTSGHYVICWFSGVPPEIAPKPGRWNTAGKTLDDLTFVPPGAVSVKLNGGCNWHGFVRDGDAT